jgi:ATP-dependent Clp protease ATP-binding subunit ClpC
MTSNTGSRQLKEFGTGVGFNTKTRESKGQQESNSVIDKELKKKFAPEFLNRIDDVVMFNSLVKEDINKIISIELEKLVSRVQKMDFELEITEGATDYIAYQGFDPEYGARPLKRAIQKYVEDVLTEEIIQQNPEKMSKLLLDYNKEDDKMVVVITSPPKKKVTRRKKDTDTE